MLQYDCAASVPNCLFDSWAEPSAIEVAESLGHATGQVRPATSVIRAATLRMSRSARALRLSGMRTATRLPVSSFTAWLSTCIGCTWQAFAPPQMEELNTDREPALPAVVSDESQVRAAHLRSISGHMKCGSELEFQQQWPSKRRRE